MKGSGLATIAALGLVAGCGLFGGRGSASAGAPEPARTPAAVTKRVGEPLELRVPRLGGGVLDLAELRGRAVLLELSDAATPDRAQAQARYRALVEREGEAVVVVSVAVDAQRDALPAAWLDDPPPFELGWDPQGAVAARLGLGVLPTVVLLDSAGVVVAVHEGTPPDDDALERWLHPGG